MTTLAEMSWETRAIAAEKTVAVLKRKVQSLYDGTSRSIIDRQLEEARRRAEGAARRRELAEVRNAELERHSHALEAEVAARTSTIRTILDNVTFGFFLVDAEGRVAPGCTRSCADLFGADITGRPLTGLLATDAAAASGLEASLQQVFDDILPEQVSLSLLPRQVRADARTLSVDGRVVRAPDGAVAQVLFSVADISELEAARRETELNRCLVQVLRQRNAFRAFVADARDQLLSARQAIEKGDQPSARRAVHTVKGNSACYGLREVVETCHAVESAPVLDGSGVDTVEKRLREFLDEHREVLGIDYHDRADNMVALDAAALDRLDAIARRLADSELREFTSDLRLRPATEVLGPVSVFIERLARRLQKDVELVTSGLDIDLDIDRYRGVLSSVTHLLRNAIDHGIERPELRQDKPRRGRVELRVVPHVEHWEVLVRDDGRGLDRDRVIASAVAAGRITPAQARDLSAEELVDLVFSDGLSTAEETTDISGRGVGLAAVKEAVEQAGARIRVESSPRQGCAFHIELPRRALVTAR
jgi:two-component system chemotaxis sensor kinase CheA